MSEKVLELEERCKMNSELEKLVKKYVKIQNGIIQYLRVTAQVEDTTQVEIKLSL
jgi:hypothetical protein